MAPVAKGNLSESEQKLLDNILKGWCISTLENKSYTIGCA